MPTGGRDWLILGSTTPDGETAAMLGIASVLGMAWSVADLAGLAAVPVARLLPTVRAALASGILVEEDKDFRFSQQLVRDVYYAGLPGPMRDALHREAAQVLRDRGAPTEEVTRHLRLADPERGENSADRDFSWQSLTDKERAVAALIAQGLTNVEIAEQLGISRRTVENHLYRIFPKLGIASRVQLALYADNAR